MKKIYYEKIGRKYVPVSEYDSGLIDALPKGAHLIMSYPGGQSTRYRIDPAHAPMIAAGRVAEDAISKKLMEASELRMQRQDRERKLTEGQKVAWENLVKEFGASARQLEWPSIRECAEAGVEAMIEEANYLMAHPSVKEAWEHFLFIAKLAYDTKEVDVK